MWQDSVQTESDRAQVTALDGSSYESGQARRLLNECCKIIDSNSKLFIFLNGLGNGSNTSSDVFLFGNFRYEEHWLLLDLKNIS